MATFNKIDYYMHVECLELGCELHPTFSYDGMQIWEVII